jgi:hypothetical protein
MTTFKRSKEDELNPTQDFDGGFINVPDYTTLEMTGLIRPSDTFSLVINTDTGILNFWDGTVFRQIINVP